MALKSKLLLAATTSAANSTGYGIEQKGGTITFICDGLAGAEKAYLEIYEPISAAYVDCYIDGSQPYCDATNNIINISMPGSFRLAKDESVGSVGVSVYSVDQ